MKMLESAQDAIVGFGKATEAAFGDVDKQSMDLMKKALGAFKDVQERYNELLEVAAAKIQSSDAVFLDALRKKAMERLGVTASDLENPETKAAFMSIVNEQVKKLGQELGGIVDKGKSFEDHMRGGADAAKRTRDNLEAPPTGGRRRDAEESSGEWFFEKVQNLWGIVNRSPPYLAALGSDTAISDMKMLRPEAKMSPAEIEDLVTKLVPRLVMESRGGTSDEDYRKMAFDAMVGGYQQDQLGGLLKVGTQVKGALGLTVEEVIPKVTVMIRELGLTITEIPTLIAQTQSLAQDTKLSVSTVLKDIMEAASYVKTLPDEVNRSSAVGDFGTFMALLRNQGQAEGDIRSAANSLGQIRDAFSGDQQGLQKAIQIEALTNGGVRAEELIRAIQSGSPTDLLKSMQSVAESIKMQAGGNYDLQRVLERRFESTFGVSAAFLPELREMGRTTDVDGIRARTQSVTGDNVLFPSDDGIQKNIKRMSEMLESGFTDRLGDSVRNVLVVPFRAASDASQAILGTWLQIPGPVREVSNLLLAIGVTRFGTTGLLKKLFSVTGITKAASALKGLFTTAEVGTTAATAATTALNTGVGVTGARVATLGTRLLGLAEGAGIIGIIVLGVQQLVSITSKFSELGGFKDIASLSLIDWDKSKSGISTILDKMKEAAGWLANTNFFFTSFFIGFKNLEKLFDDSPMAGRLNELRNLLTGIVVDQLEKLQAGFKFVATTVKDFWETAKSGFTYISSALGNIGLAIKKTLEPALAALKPLFDPILAFFDKVWEKVRPIVEFMGKAFNPLTHLARILSSGGSDHFEEKGASFWDRFGGKRDVPEQSPTFSMPEESPWGPREKELAPYRDAILAASQKNNLDPNLLASVIWQESRGKADAVSPMGARGLMQIMPATGRDLGLNTLDDFNNPEKSINAGASYLATQMKSFGGNIEMALAAYNAGPGNARRMGERVFNIPETGDYVAKITADYARRSLEMRPISTQSLSQDRTATVVKVEQKEVVTVLERISADLTKFLTQISSKGDGYSPSPVSSAVQDAAALMM